MNFFENTYFIFVEPESPENIGAICRVIKNFGFKKLILVNPQCDPYSEKAFVVSKHAKDVLKSAEIIESIDYLLKKFDLNIGTSGIFAKKSSKVLRNPLTIEEFAKNIKNYEGKIAIYLGRESIGLTNEELNKMDLLITIPTNPEYPILNVSHAAGIIAYELFKQYRNPVRKKFKLISAKEKRVLKKLIKLVIKKLDIQEYRKPVMLRAFYNLFGKAMISQREFSIFAGFFRTVYEQMKNKRD